MDETVYATRQDAKAAGWFSRRHVSRGAQDTARESYKGKQALKGPIADWERELLSGDPVDHSSATQLARLDARLGVGVGAVRERAKLARS